MWHISSRLDKNKNSHLRKLDISDVVKKGRINLLCGTEMLVYLKSKPCQHCLIMSIQTRDGGSLISSILEKYFTLEEISP